MKPFLPIPKTIAEISPAWLTETLRRHGWIAQATVIAVESRAIGMAVGFLDGLAQLRLTYDQHETRAPASVVVKIPSTEGVYHQIGQRYHAYEREIRFYAEIASRSPIRLPCCFCGSMDAGTDAYLLMLEDLSELTAGDQVQGLNPVQAQAAVETVGRFHAAWWEKPGLESFAWMPTRNIQPDRYRRMWPRFRQLVGPHLPAAALALGDQLNIHLESLLDALEQRPHTIVHSDFRADNMLFADLAGPEPVVILDWQLAIRSRGVLDVARLLCGSMASAERAASEIDILRRWHDTLVKGGVRDYSIQEVVQDYQRGALLCLYFPVTIHEAEEAAGSRGVALADAQIERFFTAALELETESVLPKA
ncbi:hypothetical protein AYO44_12260 [Planctomycetaceae bacterium SCGC AG-212-F19]|nr:hypothetical protein AYO44_12260 [Planctomycetaceae bacterium SCGC AG-212-F19]